jgi:hypothetical protein
MEIFMTRIPRLFPALFLAFFLNSQANSALAEQSRLPSSTIESMKATQQQVAEFKANEMGLLKSNPIGGVQLSATVKALVLAQPSLIDDLLELIKQANSRQAAAIGAGVGQAAKILSVTDQALANSLAAKIAANGNEQLLAGYNAGSSETSTFAVSGRGGQGFAGGGTGGPVNSSPFAGGGSHSDQAQANGSPNIGGQSRTFGGAATSCTSSVSPYNPC